MFAAAKADLFIWAIRLLRNHQLIDNLNDNQIDNQFGLTFILQAIYLS
jgi:hypothetical protein